MVSGFHVRRGRCSWCGAEVPGVPLAPGVRQCEGLCPKCNRTPFFLDDVGPWVENVAHLSEADALAIIRTIDDDREIETLFRVEFLGLNRDSVLNALHDRYWQVVEVRPENTSYGRRLTLAELRAAWARELLNEDSRRMYLMLAET